MTLEDIKKIKDTHHRLYCDLGREPLGEEMATELGYEIERVHLEVPFAIAYENEDYNPDPSLKIKITTKNNEMEKARLALGLDQSVLAEKVGIGMATICQIECCKVYPNDEIQNKISKILGISVQVLFPKWLQTFTNKWKRQEKEKIIPIREISLGTTPETLLLESGDYDDMIHQTDSGLMNKQILKVMNLVLRPREQKVLELRYGFDGSGGRTLEEVEQMLGITRERVRQIETKAFEKIRPKIKEFELL